MRRVGPALVALLIGMAWWQAVSRWSGVAEPWDAPLYWPVGYPGALVMAALLGAKWPRHGWVSGAIVVLAQLPVVVVASGVGPMFAAGVIYAAVLPLPAIAVAAFTGWIRGRAGR